MTVAYTFFSVMQQPHWYLGRLIVEVSRSHTIIHTYRVRILWACRRGRHLHNTQQTNFHAVRWIRTLDLINQTASVPDLRPHGHRDRQFKYLLGNLFSRTIDWLCEPDSLNRNSGTYLQSDTVSSRWSLPQHVSLYIPTVKIAILISSPNHLRFHENPSSL